MTLALVIENKAKKINPSKLIKEKQALMDRVTDELEEEGAIIFKPQELDGTLNIDTEYISIPHDLTEVHSRDLGNHLNALTQQKAYMRTLYNWQEMCLEEAKRQYYDVYVPIYMECMRENPKMSEKAKELICNNNELVKEKFLEYRDARHKVSMIANSISSFEEMIFLVSREISRRGQDFNEERRIVNLK